MRRNFDVKWIPNMITLSRILLCILLLYVEPLSLIFYVIYIVAILSDLLDGFVARKLKAISFFGSKLDSIADFVLFVVIGIIIVSYTSFTNVFWYSFVIVLILRIISVLICFVKFHQLVILHTYMNKIVGFLCIVIPFALKSDWFRIYAWIVIFVAILSVFEEILIHLMSSKLDADCMGLVVSKRSYRGTK